MKLFTYPHQFIESIYKHFSNTLGSELKYFNMSLIYQCFNNILLLLTVHLKIYDFQPQSIYK